MDDFLIAETDLQQTFHTAKYHSGNPVLQADRAWEKEGRVGDGAGPCAMPFSDGVWYDPEDELFKMWYMGGYVYHTCYATSRDGLDWEKPALDVHPGTNIVFHGASTFAWQGQSLPGGSYDTTVWLDLGERDPRRRYKMSRFTPNKRSGKLSIFYSPDGIHWEPVGRCGHSGDRSTLFYNPFRKVWAYSLRDYWEPAIEGTLRKFRRYWEGDDLISAIENWNERTDVDLWFCLDRHDLMRPDMTDPTRYAEVYNLDAVAYESLMLGLFSVLQGQQDGRPKLNEVFVGFSRDGWHWDRPYRRPFIPVAEQQEEWNWGNVQSAGGCCLVVGDELYFYVSGRTGRSSGAGTCSTGLAVLRRDGFASMRAFDSEGTLTTRSLRFAGKHLFVNADLDEGELRVEILDTGNRIIHPFTRDNCIPLRADATQQPVLWKGGDDLADLAGRPVRFRFCLTGGDLYAFWVSPESSGASHGYVAAGGPGFAGPTDTAP